MVRNLMLTALLFSAPAFAGNEGAHGGAGIFCTKNLAVNEFNGFYMLDYVLMRGDSGGKTWPYPAAFDTMADYNQILDWIEAGIHDKLPKIAANFHTFRATVFVDQPGALRRWIAVAQLPRIWDQGLGLQPWESDEEVNFKSSRLPPNCLFRDISQTAVKYRRPGLGFVAYAYIQDLVDQLKASGPLQVSYLVVHEWLRNFTNDAEVIRRSNRLFHSTAIQELDQTRLRQMLHDIFTGSNSPAESD